MPAEGEENNEIMEFIQDAELEPDEIVRFRILPHRLLFIACCEFLYCTKKMIVEENLQEVTIEMFRAYHVAELLSHEDAMTLVDKVRTLCVKEVL
ncbi:hypothetical protein TTRE_0000341601 [Trichuris trichiura]|uniref:Uncharacterized protein n=1 Tax=Trichuris trichiura TaxID=36087 RepID=A0A077Z5S9_TRITR|nr:hypothetical protein TTRE_0000341601 [Trichuris trichiura]